MNNAKSFWSVVNDLTNRKKTSNSLSALINAHHDNSTLANIINDKFCASFVKSNELPQIIDSEPVQTIFSEHEVFLNLIHLNTNKAAPRGELSAFLLKEAACVLAKPLCHLMNRSMQSKVVPNAWKRAEVIPIPKSEPATLDKLRPISLLPIPMKLLEKLVLSANKNYIINNIDEQQYGFKPLSSSTCALIDIDNHVREQLDLKPTKAVCLVTFDFSKAFDKIDHSLLIEKIQNMTDTNGIGGFDLNFISWLTSYCTNRTQRVRINNVLSHESAVTSGVPQGSPLAPYLFSLFVADLTTTNTKARLTKFADDTSLLITLQKMEDLKDLKNEISNVFNWADQNRMLINNEKCSVLYFKKPNAFRCLLPNSIMGIKACQNLKLLGITFNEQLCFKDHFNLILKRASQRLYYLRVLKNYYCKKELWNVFNTLIRSILEYAHPIFVNLPAKTCVKIELIQKRAHKIICGIANYKNCTDCVLIPLEERRKILAMRLFKKMNLCLNHPLSKLVHRRSERSTAFILPTINTNRYRNGFINSCTIVYNNTMID